MKRRVQQTKGKLKLSKKNFNIPNIQAYFKMPVLKLSKELHSSNNNTIKYVNSKSSELHLIKNPSTISDSNKDFQKINENVEKYILINSLVIDNLFSKLYSCFVFGYEFNVIFFVFLYPQKFLTFSLIFSSSKLFENKLSEI